jgi:hypothetical protein
MKKLLITLFLFSITIHSKELNKDLIINQTISELSKLKSANYTIYSKSKDVYSERNGAVHEYKIEEVFNPKDEHIGGNYIQYRVKKKQNYLDVTYNGKFVYRNLNYPKRISKIELNSEKQFRFVTPMFYSKIKNYLNYIQNSSDSISVTIKKLKKSYHITLTLNSDFDLIFHKQPIKIPRLNNFFIPEGPNFEVWINKTSFLPIMFKYYSTHYEIVDKIFKVEFDNIDTNEFENKIEEISK